MSKTVKPPVSIREYIDLKIEHEREVTRVRLVAECRALKIRRKYIEKRLSDLNGEASRIQTVLNSTVQKGIFESYVSSERERSDATIKAQRDHFDSYANAQVLKQDEYQRTQSAMLKAYMDDMAKWRSLVSVQMARWAGGLAALLLCIGFILKYAK